MLCEIALCTPLQVSKDGNAPPVYHYDGNTHSQADLIADVKKTFRGYYAGVVEQLLSFASDPSKAVAPFDVVCDTLKRARIKLQVWYNDVLCVRRERHASRRWRRTLSDEHEQRMLKFHQDVRVARGLRSMKGRSIQDKSCSTLETPCTASSMLTSSG